MIDAPSQNQCILWVYFPQGICCRLVFERKGMGIWMVQHAGPSLDSLVGKEHNDVKGRLEAMGCTWKWKEEV